MKKIYIYIVIFSSIMTVAFAQNKADAWRKIGLEYLTRQQAEKAIPYLKQAVRITPENGVLHSELAYAYQLLEDNENALMEYTASIGLSGTSIKDVKFNIGILYAKENKWDDALHSFNEVLQLDAEYKDVYLNRGIIKIQKGQYREAEKDLVLFLELDPQNEQRPEIEGMIEILKQMRDFPINTVDKDKYLEKRRLENDLNKNRERLNNSPNNQFLGTR